MPVLIILLIALVMFVLAPLAVLWALNTLFALGLAYTFTNWLAVFVLIVVLSARNTTVKT